jgi:predicted O-methyltransferase YrrM
MLKLFIEYLHYIRVKLKLNRKSELLRIIKKQNPKSILEIGVDEGENALRLISAIPKKDNLSNIRYVGVDLFSLMTSDIARHEASQIPKSKQDVEFLITSNFPNIEFELFEGNSNEILKTIKEKFEIIFIDGGHSYETVKKDVELSESLLSDGGLIILDDYTNRNAEVKAGYGITRLVSELDKNKWDIQISRLPDLFWHDWGLLITRLVILRKIKY